MNIECSQGRHAGGGRFCTKCGQGLVTGTNQDGRNDIIWGIVILAVAGGITLGTYIAAAPGSTYLIAFGPMIWGGFKVFRGLASASNSWRVLGLATLAAVAIGSILVFQSSRDQSDYHNSVEVGDCVDQYGLPTECARPGAYEVISVKLYPDDMTFPGDAKFYADSEACPVPASVYFAPIRETWDEGDRLLMCVITSGLES